MHDHLRAIGASHGQPVFGFCQFIDRARISNAVSFLECSGVAEWLDIKHTMPKTEKSGQGGKQRASGSCSDAYGLTLSKHAPMLPWASCTWANSALTKLPDFTRTAVQLQVRPASQSLCRLYLATAGAAETCTAGAFSFCSLEIGCSTKLISAQEEIFSTHSPTFKCTTSFA